MTLAPSRDETPTGGPTYDLFVSYAAADRSWVEGYLFDALDAAGVRYVSESAFELGAPRVAEFERAVRESRRTLLVITPAYLADAYAPFGDLLAQTFGVETGSWPVIPLTLEEAPIPPRLAMLVALDATRPHYWSSAVEKLCAAVNRPVPASPPPPCPYPGMLPFREADAARFFGRDAEVAEMVERLRLHRFLAVIGPSGSGKSSLVLAGLLPALRSSGLFGSGEWLPVVFRPGATPVEALRLALGGAADPTTAIEAMLSRQPDASRLLLVCDQFEEAFTVGREQATPFQEQLARLAGSERCWVVVTARADFYADLMSAPLWSEIRANRVEVTPLGETGLRDGHRPARRGRRCPRRPCPGRAARRRRRRRAGRAPARPGGVGALVGGTRPPVPAARSVRVDRRGRWSGHRAKRPPGGDGQARRHARWPSSRRTGSRSPGGSSCDSSSSARAAPTPAGSSG